jgi:hypothetical protein
MTQSLDKIDLLKERANISYKEAAALLEKFDGNVVEVLIHLESKEETMKTQQREIHQHKRHNHRKSANKVISEVNSTRFILQNDKNKLLDIPLIIALIVSIVTIPFSIFVLIGLAVAGNQIVIKKKGGSAFKLDQVFKVVNEDDLEEETKKEEAGEEE